MSFHSHNAHDGDDFSPLSEINVTPFIDVMLVLLIIFMITAPLLAAGMKVELPQAKTAQPMDNHKPVVVTVGAAGELQVGDRGVSRAELIAVLRAELGGADRHIQVRGDAHAGYGEVVGVLDLLASNGLAKIALITQKQRDPRAEPAR